MTDIDLEDGAGRFSAADRTKVTAESLPWLASYFADAPTWSLTSQAAVGQPTDTDTVELSRLIRMRVALASMRRLEPLVRQVLVQPSFAYTRRVEESVGALRGPLDTQRYIRSRTRPESPRRYPVRVVHRRFDTDENELTTYAVMHRDRDLAAAPVHLLPTNAPERREIERGRS
ncbi:MAG: hypothetical protein AB7Q27_26215, partial [Acidimicrobiia bacterium]